VKESRGELVHAILTIVQSWVAAGRPMANSAPLGSYEHWSGVMGGILAHAGVEGFLGNLPTFYERADREGEAWREFIRAWWLRFVDAEVGVAELFRILDSGEVELDLGTGSERSQKSRLGREIQRQRDRRFGDLTIEFSRSYQGVARYRLVKVGTGGE
jgi:hypothetical protein